MSWSTQREGQTVNNEAASVMLTTRFLRGELDGLGRETAAAQLYTAFIDALDKVYPGVTRTASAAGQPEL